MWEWLKTQIYVDHHPKDLVELSAVVLAAVTLFALLITKPSRHLWAVFSQWRKARIADVHIKVEQRGGGVYIELHNTCPTAIAKDVRIISDCFVYPLHVGDIAPLDYGNDTYWVDEHGGDYVIEVRWKNNKKNGGCARLPYSHKAELIP